MKRVNWDDIKTRRINQDIVISGSIFFKYIEWISFFVHIIVLTLGIISLVGMFVIEDETTNMTLEVTTLILVAIVVIEHVFMRYYTKHSVKRTIRSLWGESIPESNINVIDSNEVFKNLETGSFNAKETVDVYWLTKNYILDLKILVFSGEIELPNSEEMIKYYHVPSYIVNDVKERVLEFKTKVHFFVGGKEIIKEINYKMDYKNKEVNWTGEFPEFQAFGKWNWK